MPASMPFKGAGDFLTYFRPGVNRFDIFGGGAAFHLNLLIEQVRYNTAAIHTFFPDKANRDRV